MSNQNATISDLPYPDGWEKAWDNDNKHMLVYIPTNPHFRLCNKSETR